MIFERELARLAVVQVKSLGKPEEEGTFKKVFIVQLALLAFELARVVMVQVAVGRVGDFSKSLDS